MKLTTKRFKARPARDILDTGFKWHGLRDEEDGFYVAATLTTGHADLTGRPYLVPIELCNEPAAFYRCLAAGGIVVPGDILRKQTLIEACAVRNFDRAFIAARPGYNGHLYGRPGGVVIGPFLSKDAKIDGETALSVSALTGYPEQLGKSKTAGTRKHHLEGLRILAGQDILIFGYCTGLVPLILKFSPDPSSFGVELVGPTCSGKSTVTRLAASAYGTTYIDAEMEDIEYLVGHGLEDALDLSNDQPLLLEGLDSWFALDTDREKLSRVRDYDKIFRHRIKLRGGTVSKQARIVAWSTSQEPIEDLCGNDEAARARLGHKLLTLRVPEDRPGMVVATTDQIQDASAATDLVTQLSKLLRANAGHAAPRMIRKILETVATDEDQLTARVAELIDDFAQSTIDTAGNAALRLAARRFGLIYAAGCLGQEWGAVPTTWDMHAAILACYHMYSGQSKVPFIDRLRVLAKNSAIFDLGSKKLPLVTKETRKSAIAYARQTATELRLLVRQDAISDVFPDWNILKGKKSVRRLMVTERSKRKDGSKHVHWTVKQALGKDRKPERVYCFILPLSEESDNGD